MNEAFYELPKERKYFTFFSLFDPSGAAAGESGAVLGALALLLGVIWLYAAGIAVFCRKEFPDAEMRNIGLACDFIRFQKLKGRAPNTLAAACILHRHRRVTDIRDSCSAYVY